MTKTIIFDMDDPDWDAYDALGEKLRAKIAATPEYHAARNGITSDGTEEEFERDEHENEPPDLDIPF